MSARRRRHLEAMIPILSLFLRPLARLSHLLGLTRTLGRFGAPGRPLHPGPAPRPPLGDLPQTTSSKALAARRKRTRSAVTSVTAALALTGLIVGAAGAAQTNQASSARIAATAELTSSTGRQADQLGVYPQTAKAHADGRAKNTLRDATVVMASTRDKVDVGPLAASVTSLSNYRALDLDAVLSLTDRTLTASATAQAAADEADRAAAAAATALAAANTPDGARATARDLAASQHGWGEAQFSCLSQLWAKESGWSYTALNASSGATGIPQALPGSKMATAGSDWKTNASTQITWGLDYISRGYGTPCSAWSHSQAVNWY